MELEEIRRGWASDDLNSIAKPSETGTIRPELLRCGRPGMTADELAPGTPVRVVGMHPELPTYEFMLPDEIPYASLVIGPRDAIELEPRLTTVELRMEDRFLIMTWCCSAETDREYEPLAVYTAAQGLSWQHAGEG